MKRPPVTVAACLGATAALALSLLHLPAAAAHEGDATAQLESLSRAFRDAYTEAEASVVLVETSARRRITFRALPPSHPHLGPEEGIGSGTIVSDDGYILSNYHVVKDTDAIRVILSDRRSFDAEVVGFDSLIDIAVLKVDADGLPVARLGQSKPLQIGDWVLAIGHPLKMGATLTHGIVSALGRQVDVIDTPHGIESFIQTNAVINPGNSGGPLLNLRGEVVGINTAISTKTGYYMGYGLAVPIDLAREAMADIIEHGRVVRGYMGVEMSPIDWDLMSRLGMEWPRGVFLKTITADTPAARSGLLAGDVLLAVDGVGVELPNEVQTLMYSRNPGESVSLSILRDGLELDLPLVLGEREEDQLLAQGRRRIDELGLIVQSVSSERADELGFTAEIADELGFAAGERAVVVVDIDPDGLAAAKGIRVDDVITEVDQHLVSSMDEFARFVSRLEVGKSALFWFWRHDRGIYIRAMKIGAEEG